jgi:hypothetical protein
MKGDIRGSTSRRAGKSSLGDCCRPAGGLQSGHTFEQSCAELRYIGEGGS